MNPTLKAKPELLDVSLEERATDDDEPIEPDDAPPDRTVNHRDTDARWGAKGKNKFFFGYKCTILTNKASFVVTLGVGPGNVSDEVVLDVVLEDAKAVFDVEPEKVVGDAAYCSLDNLLKIKDKGVQLVTSLKPAPNPKGKFSRDRFTFDPETRTLACTSGETTQESFASQDGEGAGVSIPGPPVRGHASSASSARVATTAACRSKRPSPACETPSPTGRPLSIGRT